MNGKDLLIGLGDIGQKYYQEAENDVAVSGHRTLKRPLLVAAIITLTLALVGCAVVYALRLQDMSIGKETYTQTFDDEGKYLEEPVEKTRDIITIYGHSGDPIQKALTEWFEFLNTYDPDGKLMDNNPDHEEIPNQYEYTYSCYTQDMIHKVDEIAAKYNLKLLDAWIPFQQYQSDIFFEETGIVSFLRTDSGAKMSNIAGMWYPPYNFDMDFSLSTDVLEMKIWGTIIYAQKDYLPRAFPGGMDLSQFEQWDYTAPDGTPLLLALSSKGSGYVIAEPENAMLILNFDGNFSGSAYPKEEEIMTKAELEALADLFDYSICPQRPNREVVEQKLAEAQTAYDTAHTYVPETYGSYNEYLKENVRIYDDDLQYTFYDLTGDGKEDLLFGKNGAFDNFLYIKDGELVTQQYGNTFVCEDGILENFGAYEIFEEHKYMMMNFETDPNDMDTMRNSIISVNRTRDRWIALNPGDFEGKEITEEEAQSIMAQYPRVELEWRPLMEYPLSEDETLGDYLEAKDVRLSGDELLKVYKDYLKKRAENGNMYYSHYRILDINGDGVEDLLLKGEDSSYTGITDFWWIALTYRYGVIEGFGAMDFYLCEDGVIENTDTRHAGGFGVEKNGHQFMRCNGFEEELYELVVYNKSTGGWQTDWWDDEPISDEEANAILAKYPRIDQGMRPIEELLN